LTLEVSGRCHSACQVTVDRGSGPLDRIVRRQGTRWLGIGNRGLRKSRATAACTAQPAPSRPDGVNIGNSESPRNLKKRSWSDDLLSAGSRGVAAKGKAIWTEANGGAQSRKA